MKNTNLHFLETYKTVDRFLKDALRRDEGVSAYLKELEPFLSQASPSFRSDYLALKHCRWIRNQLAHEAGFDENLAQSEDVSWLEGFLLRLKRCEDPLSLAEKVHKPSRSTAVRSDPARPRTSASSTAAPVRKSATRPANRKKTVWERMEAFVRKMLG